MFEPTVVVESLREMLSFQQGHPWRNRQRAPGRHARVVRGEPQIYGHRTLRPGNPVERVREVGHLRADRSAKRSGTLQRAV